MIYRPWPIVVLAFLYFFGPIVNLTYGAWLLNAKLIEFIPYYFTNTPTREILTSFCLPWVAGLCIYRLKEWSFFAFHGIMLTILYQNYTLYRDFPSVYPLSLMVATYLFNIALVSYFFLPTVRASYLNRRLRWWESLPRYEIKAPAIVEHAKKRVKGKIANLSQGGAFLITPEKIKKGTVIRIAFTVFKQSCIISAKVVHFKKEIPSGYGLQFEHTPVTKITIRQIINTLVSEGVKPRQYRERDFFNELIIWGMTLLRTGKGWVPEIPLPLSNTPVSETVAEPQFVERRKKPRNKMGKVKTIVKRKSFKTKKAA